MAEKAVSDIKDSGKELLEKLSEIEVFKREQQSTVQRVMDDLSRAPAPKQMAVGGVAGWAAGYVTMKAGKMAATAIGGTLILLQIAHHKGYIKVRRGASYLFHILYVKEGNFTVAVVIKGWQIILVYL